MEAGINQKNALKRDEPKPPTVVYTNPTSSFISLLNQPAPTSANVLFL